jgi:hypothetical protein
MTTQQTTFRTKEDAKGIQIEILGRRKSDDQLESFYLPAEELVTLDAIMWTGYYVNNFAIIKRLPFKYKSFIVK